MSAANELPYTAQSECFKITLTQGVWKWRLPHFADSIGRFELDVPGVLTLEEGCYMLPDAWSTICSHQVGPGKEPVGMINLAKFLDYYPYRLRVSAPGVTAASLRFVGFAWKDRKKWKTVVPQPERPAPSQLARLEG